MQKNNILHLIVHFIMKSYNQIILNYDIRTIEKVTISIKKLGFNVYETGLSYNELKILIDDIKYFVINKNLKKSGQLYDLLGNINNLKKSLNSQLKESNTKFNFYINVITKDKNNKLENATLNEKMQLSIKEIFTLFDEIDKEKAK
jgi:hypothetical protein